jgi:hypothetical protein
MAVGLSPLQRCAACTAMCVRALAQQLGGPGEHTRLQQVLLVVLHSVPASAAAPRAWPTCCGRVVQAPLLPPRPDASCMKQLSYCVWPGMFARCCFYVQHACPGRWQAACNQACRCAFICRQYEQQVAGARRRQGPNCGLQPGLRPASLQSSVLLSCKQALSGSTSSAVAVVR